MAISYFPNKIRTFTTHRNYLDTVDASHLNNVQAELLAVMKSLGTSPQVFNDVQVDNVPTSVVPNDQGGLSSDDTLSFATTVRYYDPKVKPVDHGTVGQRLDDIERGYQHHSFRLRATNLTIGSGSISLATRPTGIRFPKPSDDVDPYAMHNGVGVTLRKTGFWVFAGSVAYTLQGSTAGSNNGVYQAAVDIDNTWIDGMDRSQETGVNMHPILNPLIMGFYSRGQRVSLRTSHNSGRNQVIRNARLTGFLLRETPGA